MPHPEGYRKALRLMKQAEKFNRPIICFIDTKGAYPGKAAEERGQSEAIARNLFEMAGLTVPVICIVIGEGGSGGALGLGVERLHSYARKFHLFCYYTREVQRQFFGKMQKSKGSCRGNENYSSRFERIRCN